ncbi:MAG: flagellin hook IN motif-containing protein [Planctomycetota bacterium]
MQVGGVSPFGQLGLGSTLKVQFPALSVPSWLLPVGTGGKDPLDTLTKSVVGLRSAFDELRLSARVRSTNLMQGSGATVSSGNALGLDVSSTATTLSSSAALAPAPTSVSTTTPEFEGASTAAVKVSGTYDGSYGDETLTFRVRVGGGSVGSDLIGIEVLNKSGTRVDVVVVQATYTPGEELELDSGLRIALGPGTALQADSFELDVFASADGVDPDKPLDGGALEGAVSAGILEINGTAVLVQSGESLNDVLASITASAAGVTASFNAETSRVELVQKTIGSAGEITLGADSTGFFDAAELSSATPLLGRDGDLSAALDDVAAFASISAGSFSINGVALSIDPAQDSLQDVLDAINLSVTGVTASYDEDADAVTLSGVTAGILALEDDGTGVFAALGIGETSYLEPTAIAVERRVADRAAFRSDLNDLARVLGDFFDEDFGGSFNSSFQASSARTRIEDALRGALELVLDDVEGDVLRTDFGLTVNFGAGDELIEIDSARLDAALRQDPEAVASFLYGPKDAQGEEGGGLIERLGEALGETAQSLLGVLDPYQGVGLALDLEG